MTPRMDKDRNEMTKSIFCLTLDILHLLTGEDYTIVRKTSGECVAPSSHLQESGGRSRTLGPITEPPPHSPIPEEKILELIYRITDLLTREVPIRCQDVAVYFSMEEWKYVEGHKDQYKDQVMMEDQQPLTSPDIFPLRMEKDRDSMEERILHLTQEIIYLLTGEDYLVVKKTAEEDEDRNMGQGRISLPPPHSLLQRGDHHQEIRELINTMTELLTGEVSIRCQDVAVYFSMEEWEYVEGHKDQYKDQVMMEDQQPLTSADSYTGRSEENLLSSDYKADDDITQYTYEEHSIIQDTPSALHSQDLSSHPVIQVLSSNLPQTVKKNKEKPFSCSQCEKCFTQKSDLVKHQRTHTGEKPFLCAECGKCFTEKSNLIKHQRIHTGEKLFSCSECGKCFTQKIDLVQHQRIHTGEKPFSCSECGKCFTRKSYLTEHERTHTGEKLYACLECGKCFTQKSNLVKHEKTHTGEKPFSCIECGKGFIHKSQVVKHQKSHTGEKPFSCSECGKCYTQKSKLINHLRIHTLEKPI